MSRIIIHLAAGDPSEPAPWPIGVSTANWRVTTGLGEDDGSVLIGFGPAGEQRITLLARDALADPAQAVGLTASFSDGEEFFLWKPPVESIEVFG